VLAYERQRPGARDGTASPSAAARLPVTIVTGYLGSGKTTLIAELLRAPDMSGTAVIVNELAEIGIDQSIIAEAGAGEVVLLSNGCLCCARGTDLANTVGRLAEAARTGSRSIERLLIETSGAADPASIIRQINFNPQLRSAVRYGGVLCLFDAAFGRDHMERDPVGYRQIALADMILVTKTDLVEPATTAELLSWLAGLNRVPQVTTSVADAADFLTGRSRNAGRAGSIAWLGVAEEAGAPHAADIGSWSIEVDEAIDWNLAEQTLRVIYDRLGDDILRTKGIIRTRDDDRPLVIHGINRHFHRPLRLGSWDGAPRTRLVVIGFAGAHRAAEEIAGVLGGSISGQARAPKS
jgi:G3E family GTPase